MSEESPIYAARCVMCTTSFTEAEIANKSCCPNCLHRGVPMDPTKDVTITVNVHELRILGIWAENYAVSCDNHHLDDAGYEPLKDTIKAITDRLRAQLRELGKDAPLTLSAEFKQIEQEYPSAEFYRDGKEEVPE